MSVPHADVTTDAVSILHTLFGCWCRQCVHAVKVKVVVKRRSVCRNSMVWDRPLLLRTEEGVSLTNKHSTTTTARNMGIAGCGWGSEAYVCDAVQIVCAGH
jgi:hypothetical protein